MVGEHFIIVIVNLHPPPFRTKNPTNQLSDDNSKMTEEVDLLNIGKTVN